MFLSHNFAFYFYLHYLEVMEHRYNISTLILRGGTTHSLTS